MTNSFESLRLEFERVIDQARQEIAAAMKEAAAEMEAAKAEITREMERARREIAAAMAEAAGEMEEAKADVKDAMDEARRRSKAWDFGQSPQVKPSGKARRPRRRPPGGEPAPAEPKPKPKPLVGGAEAPLD